MTKQILITLKEKLNDLAIMKSADAEILRNVAKEELQYYVLDFVYHHPEYSKWIMYGGSALRICHGLNRMSVDLDFEIASPCAKSLLQNLKKEVKDHFLKRYGLGTDFLTIKIVNGRGLLLRFLIGEELGIKHPSKQVHLKIDINHFVAPKTVTERIPINHDQLSFVIKTYNMSTMMASKIAAVLLRRTRGIGKVIYKEKGRDIYDLLWYMEKRITPDLDYLSAKKVDISDLRALFNRLTLQMNEVSNENLKQDLSPLFLNQNYINDWLTNWHESYLRLEKAYDIRTITNLREIRIHQDSRSDNYSFVFIYNTKEGKMTRIEYTITYEVATQMKSVPMQIDDTVMQFAQFKTKENDQLKRYITLFYQKNLDYFKRTNNIMVGNAIQTKTIRMTANNLNRKEQIALNRSTLLSSELDDLIR